MPNPKPKGSLYVLVPLKLWNTQRSPGLNPYKQVCPEFTDLCSQPMLLGSTDDKKQTEKTHPESVTERQGGKREWPILAQSRCPYCRVSQPPCSPSDCSTTQRASSIGERERGGRGVNVNGWLWMFCKMAQTMGWPRNVCSELTRER